MIWNLKRRHCITVLSTKPLQVNKTMATCRINVKENPARPEELDITFWHYLQSSEKMYKQFQGECNMIQAFVQLHFSCNNYPEANTQQWDIQVPPVVCTSVTYFTQFHYLHLQVTVFIPSQEFPVLQYFSSKKKQKNIKMHISF